MGTINIKSEKKEIKIKGKAEVHDLYRRSKLKKFNPVALKLGDISARSKQIDVIAAVFDLSGFTNFCSQVDPHLSMPRFLDEFLNWIFTEIKSQLEVKRFRQGIRLYSELPFFAKFMGDGVLFLWNTENMTMPMICNIVVMLRNISNRYNRIFAPVIKRHLSHVPSSLKCGVARGIVCSVGNGEDYVGPCINIASRLQKLSNIGFCFSKRGIDFEEGMAEETAKNYMVKIVSIRGIGKGELVVVRKPDFEKLSKRDKSIFKDL
jgi:class 3 adenylate cyclase